jgi:DNA mismatch repair ATPase MutS
MSKIINEYEKLKRKDNNKLYLFKVGKFYIFIGDDVKYINNYMVLKPTKFTNNYDKCGFPIDRIENYKKVFNNLKLNIEIIDEIKDIKDILNNIDVNSLSKEDAINIIKELKEYYG